jgi:hypothetical protein
MLNVITVEHFLKAFQKVMLTLIRFSRKNGIEGLIGIAMITKTLVMILFVMVSFIELQIFMLVQTDQKLAKVMENILVRSKND